MQTGKSAFVCRRVPEIHFGGNPSCTKKAISEGGIAVVTGAASGVGLAAATRFAQAGLGVILADLPGPALEEATEKVRAAGTVGVDIFAVPTDVGDMAQVEALAEKAFQTGPVAVLMNTPASACRPLPGRTSTTGSA